MIFPLVSVSRSALGPTQPPVQWVPGVLSSGVKCGRGVTLTNSPPYRVHKVLVGKPEGKRPLGRPRRRWEDGIRMDLREIGLGVWIGFGCLRTGTGGGLLWVRWWTFGFLRHGVSYIKLGSSVSNTGRKSRRNRFSQNFLFLPTTIHHGAIALKLSIVTVTAMLWRWRDRERALCFQSSL
jgi:hypothetical protein